MKRIGIIFICFAYILLLISCSDGGVTIIGTAKTAPQGSETVPVTETVSRENPIEPTGQMLVVNKSSKKIHPDPECRYAVGMKEENRLLVDSSQLEELIAEGYEICSYCAKKASTED